MNRRLIVLLFMVLMMQAHPAPNFAQTDSTFQRGDVVVINPGLPQNLRAEPNSTSLVLTQIPPAEYALILYGPIATDGLIWWNVEYDHWHGWIAQGSENGEQWLTRVDYETHEIGGLRFRFPAGMFTQTMVADLPISAHIANNIPLRRVITLGNSTRTEVTESEEFALITIMPCDDNDVAHICEQQTNLYRNTHIPLPMSLDSLLSFPPYAYYGAGLRYITYTGGMGLRGVMYSPPWSPETEIQPTFFYGFTSVTDDGAFYITIRIPINVIGDLPEYWASNGDPYFIYDTRGYYRGYALDFYEAVRDFPPEAFTPRLPLLDAIAMSIERIEPIVIQPED